MNNFLARQRMLFVATAFRDAWIHAGGYNLFRTIINRMPCLR